MGRAVQTLTDLPKALWTYLSIVRRQAETFGDRIFCTFEDGTTLTFAQLEDESSTLAAAFAELGVATGDRVMTLAFNSREFILTMIAAQKLGAIFVPINTELKGAFLQHQLDNAEPRIVVLDAKLRSAFDAVGVHALRIAATVVIGGEAAPLPGSRHLVFQALLQGVAHNATIVATPYEVCMIMYTSGTTGPAKGVMMTHGHCFYNALIAMKRTGLGPNDRMFISMPLFHGTAALLQLYASLLAGAQVHIVRRFSASSWLADIRASGSTVTFAAGIMAEFVIKQPEHADDGTNPLRLLWSVPVSSKWGPDFERRFGVRILQAYGMTELCVPVWGDLSQPLEPGCAGTVVDDFWEIRVVDPETDESMPVGETGEIVGRPKEPGVFMSGYFRMPDKTVEAWRSLWFHTGDAGYFDARDRLFYVDRIRDRIRRRGENISAFEVEAAIAAHPGVRQCAVIGVKVADAGGEDEIMAVVISDSADLSPVGLVDWCRPRMPKYALPRFVEFVDVIEQTPTGKVRKQALRDRGVTSMTWDRASKSDLR